METILLEDIPFGVDGTRIERFLGKGAASGRGAFGEGLRHMADQALAIGRPKALYRVCRISSRGEDFVALEGQTFRSRVLAVNLEKAYRVFPFVATCGKDLENWSASFGAENEKMLARLVAMAALEAAVHALSSHIREHHHPSGISMMNPGSLQDWPMAEQRALFALLGDTGSAIGVRLKENLLMEPEMSASGLWFPTGQSFESCMLCSMEACPGRRAPYDRELFDRKYRKRSGGGEPEPAG
ncbi:MAG: vitamin B12 dependent methionine synthase [bacterium]